MKFGASAIVLGAALANSLVAGKVLRGDASTALGLDAHEDSEALKCNQKVRRRVRVKGRTQDSVEVVVKDGFWLVGCEKDTMYTSPPKNVSVIHYKDEVPKEDRVHVTPTQCFTFCRSKPGMSFFGVTRGRDCYCTPYFENEAGDDSQCDAVCEGDNTQMCGSLTKSSVYQMHACGADAVASRLNDEATAAKDAGDALRASALDAAAVAEDYVTKSGAYYEGIGGSGDGNAARLLQAAKVASGKLQNAAKDAVKTADGANDTITEATGFGSPPTPEEVKKMYPLEKKVKTFQALVKEESKSFNETLAKYYPQFSDDELAKNTSAQFYPVLYFTKEKENKDKPTTCTGDVIGEPKYVKSENACALACNAEVTSCVGYMLFGEICFLLKNFKEASFYTKCKGDEDVIPKCVAKFSEYDGTSLQPDASGNCKQCMRRLIQADRCYK